MSDPLDAPCPTCERPMGDHTMREVNACANTPTMDLPFEAVPDDMAKLASDNLRKQLQLDPNVLIADNVVIKSVLMGGPIKAGGILHEFSMQVPGAVVPVATVLFLGGRKIMGAYGDLVRDNCKALGARL